MRVFSLALAIIALPGCLWISADEHDTRRADFDADGDGVVSEDKGGRDCDDNNADVKPAADEICNDIDDNCDGVIDTDAVDATFWTIDLDLDGYGDDSTGVAACTSPGSEYVDASGDCDDADPTLHPTAPERCDGIDNDCTGTADDGEGDPWYTDSDGDGFGDDVAPEFGCDAPGPKYAPTNDDCDDAAATTYPGADERCNDVDDDCDGVVDNDPVDPTTWFKDVDGDGFGADSPTQTACIAPANHVATGGDCDDLRDSVNPGADERCNNDRDDDCDPSTDEAVVDGQPWYQDDDGDGFGVNSTKVDACEQPDGFASAPNDCDDTDPTANPDAKWYLDDDADGVGRGSAKAQCLPVSGRAPVDGDCDDDDPDAYPDAPLVCDGRDANCDDAVDNDADGDGFADKACGGDDCLDSDPDLTPLDGCADGDSCAEVLEEDPDAPTGTYLIDPDGAGTGLEPFEAPCDMDTDGGGWTLMFADDVDEDGIESGWSITGTTSCGTAGTFIGGPNKISGSTTIDYTVDLLGVPHSHVRLVATYAHIDQWAGNTGSLFADGQEVWSIEHTEDNSASNKCGRSGDKDSFSDAEGTAPHTADSVTFSAGSSISASSLVSFGVDDVEVWVR